MKTRMPFPRGQGTYKLEALLLEALDDVGNEAALDAVPVQRPCVHIFGFCKVQKYFGLKDVWFSLFFAA
jgi:hypothetical protein